MSNTVLCETNWCSISRNCKKNVWSHIGQIWVIFSHLKLWIAVARHNFKWVKNSIEELGRQRVKASRYEADAPTKNTEINKTACHLIYETLHDILPKNHSYIIKTQLSRVNHPLFHLPLIPTNAWEMTTHSSQPPIFVIKTKQEPLVLLGNFMYVFDQILVKVKCPLIDI